MKILLIAIGTRGDVQPFVTLGKALAARGHAVSIAAGGGFSKMIAAAGLRHHPLPLDFQALMQQPEIQSAMTSLRGKLKAYRWAGDLMNQQLDALWRIGLGENPELILHHFKGALAPYIARRCGAVSIPVMLQPGFMPTADYPQFLVSARSLGRMGNRASHHTILAVMRAGTRMMIRRWRKASSTDIGPPMDPMQGYTLDGAPIRIHAYSPHIVPRPPDWPASEVQTGYISRDPAAFSPPPGLADFLAADPPPVYVGFGSMVGGDPRTIMQAVRGALDLTGQRAIVATGWGGMPKGASDNRTYVIDAAPHDWLFPRMSAVVHHGGSGTTHEGLRWGRPSVVCPFFADQPFFGQCVVDLGVGPPPIPARKLSPDRLAQALETARSPAMAARAGEIGERLRHEDGAGEICNLVTMLAQGRLPPHAGKG